MKDIGRKKRSRVNLLYTLSRNDERLSVYNSTSQLILSPIERNISKKSDNTIVKDYLKKKNLESLVIWECSRLVVHGTAYKKGHIIVLPNSNNYSMIFGRITELLVSEKHSYFLYRNIKSRYCSMTDLYFLEEIDSYDMIPSHHLGCFRPLETYVVGQNNRVSLSLRCNVLC